MALKFDEIGYWSELKLEIVRRYATAYSTTFSKTYNYIKPVYIDAFAGPGKHISKSTGEEVSGSPQIALDIKPPFSEFYFIDTDGDKAEELKRITADRPEAHVLNEDCNKALLISVFPKVLFKDYKRAFCLLDPYGLALNWEVIQEAGKMRTIEIVLNFPVMDMNRNVFWTNPEKVDPSDIERMTLFWGDETWRQAAYRAVSNLFGELVDKKEPNRVIANAFQQRLLTEAGFKYVPAPLPMRNSRGASVYYLFFASHNETGKDIIESIFTHYRNKGIK